MTYGKKKMSRKLAFRAIGFLRFLGRTDHDRRLSGYCGYMYLRAAGSYGPGVKWLAQQVGTTTYAALGNIRSCALCFS